MFTTTNNNENYMALAMTEYIMGFLAKWAETDGQLQADLQKKNKTPEKMFKFVERKAREAVAGGNMYFEGGTTEEELRESNVMKWAVRYYHEDSDETDNYGLKAQVAKNVAKAEESHKKTATASKQETAPKQETKADEEEMSLFDM